MFVFYVFLFQKITALNSSEPRWIVVECAFSQFVIMTYLKVICIYIYMQLFDYLLSIRGTLYIYIYISICIIFSLPSNEPPRKSGGCSQEETYQYDECVYREAEEVSCYKRVPQIEYIVNEKKHVVFFNIFFALYRLITVSYIYIYICEIHR